MLTIQGGSDCCDEPAAAAGLDSHFESYTLIVLDGVGHFPHREEQADRMTELLREHLDKHARR